MTKTAQAVSTTDAKRPTQRRTLALNADSVAYWSGIAVVLLTVFAAVAGAIAWIASNRASEAKDRALKRFQDDANVAISGANLKAAEAVEGTAKANERAVAQGLEIRGPEKKAAAAQQERAANAERELLELRGRVADRRLVGAQSSALAAKLRSFAGQRATIFVDSDDPEAAQLAALT